MGFVSPPENRYAEHPLHKEFKVDTSVYEELMRDVAQNLANLKRSDSDYEFQLTQAKGMLEDFKVYFKTVDYSNLLEVVKTKSAPVTGLLNIGNSCYMNATLQALLPVKEEMLKVMEGKNSRTVSLVRNFLNKNGQISKQELVSLRKAVFTEAHSSGLEDDISSQQDAARFLDALLGLCGQGIKRNLCVLKAITSHSVALNVAHQPRETRDLSLQQLVDENFDGLDQGLSTLDNKTPEVLFMNIPNVKKGDIEHKIDPKDGIVEVPTLNGRTKYKLQAIVHHHGHVAKDAGGHYTASAYREGWHHIDDPKVTRCERPSKISTGYIWVLKRIKTSTR